jgi:hypothetical protein
MITFKEIKIVLSHFAERSYWNKTNTWEFIAFMTKIAIIFPGLLFGIQVWWLFIVALITSGILVLTSTVKTLPTIIVFNMLWIVLASLSIYKHFFPW